MASGYETLIITHPDIGEEELQELIDKLKATISRAGGDFLKVEKWGKRKLVYKIKGQSRGVFLLCYFLGNQAMLQEMDRLLRYNERVFRYQTMKLDQKLDIESLRQSDMQGKSEPSVREEGVTVEEKTLTEENVSPEENSKDVPA